MSSFGRRTRRRPLWTRWCIFRTTSSSSCWLVLVCVGCGGEARRGEENEWVGEREENGRRGETERERRERERERESRRRGGRGTRGGRKRAGDLIGKTWTNACMGEQLSLFARKCESTRQRVVRHVSQRVNERTINHCGSGRVILQRRSDQSPHPSKHENNTKTTNSHRRQGGHGLKQQRADTTPTPASMQAVHGRRAGSAAWATYSLRSFGVIGWSPVATWLSFANSFLLPLLLAPSVRLAALTCGVRRLPPPEGRYTVALTKSTCCSSSEGSEYLAGDGKC